MAERSLAAQTVVNNANIITVVPLLPKTQALAIRDDKFAAVGSNDDVEDPIGPGTRVLDLGWKTVIPGITDAHIHVLSSGIRQVIAADCGQRNVAAVQEALRERVSATPPGDWVKGFKFDDTKTEEMRSLNR